ncbi:MAG: hypothetical protein R3F51_28560 [Cyanobacteriota/Melainabacteria group bacterium]
MSLSRSLDAVGPGFSPESSSASLSTDFFNSPDMRDLYASVPARESGGVENGSLNITDLPTPAQEAIATELKDFPLIDQGLAAEIKAADKLTFSTPSENGEKAPDYRLVKKDDGSYELQKVNPEADPLADGEINIEIDPGDKDLAEAIKQSDQSLKEYIRELMQYFTQNNPGESPPVWWTEILNSQPNIPEQGNAKPIPVVNRGAAPSQAAAPEAPVAPEAPAESPAPSQAEAPAYSGNSGGGSSGGGGGGGGGARSYNRGGDYSPSSFPESPAPQFEDNNNFFGRLKNMLYGNESGGDPTKINEWDNNGISVGLRQWHAGGELPELLNAWQQADPQKFEQYFGGRSPAQVDQLGQSQGGVQEILPGMRQALADPEYQQVQNNLVDDFLKRTVQRGMDGGLSTERELAQYVDLTNQSPAWAEKALPLGAAPGDQSAQMEAATRGGDYGRYAAIQQQFGTGEAQLVAKVPEPTNLGVELAQAAKVQDGRYRGTGNCAAAVQEALAGVGLNQFMGSGDAWDMLGPLKRSGLFEEVPMAQATVGDIIVRPPSANPHDSSVHGDISVVTARNGNNITQTNDATYQFDPNNARYDGRAVFLRYTGGDNSMVASNESGKRNSNSAVG